MKVSATLKGKPDAYGRYAIYIRVNDGKHRKTEATSYRVLKDQFGTKKGERGLVINHPHAKQINDALRLMIAKKELGESKPFKDAAFADYVDKLIQEQKETLEYETLRQYKAEKTKLQGFRMHVKMSQITPEFLKDYMAYCRRLGNAENTLWKTCKFLRMLTRKAIREKVISEYPFDVFKMPKYTDPKKNYLTVEQLETIERNLPKLKDLQYTATWLLICCYSGLRYGDAIKFDKKKHIKSGRIVIYTSKTGEVVSMPLSDRLKKYLESVEYKPYSKKNNHANGELRGVLAFCKITEPGFTFHCSRHTFAIMCAEKGISQEVTSKLLGHRSLATTSIYYKITNPRIDAEIGRIG